MSACADMAWWYGWSMEDIDGLYVEDFAILQQEANRQIKAGYSKGL